METAVVYTACSKGELPFLKIGKLYKFKKTDVLKWLESDKASRVVDVDAYISKYLQNNILIVNRVDLEAVKQVPWFW